MHRSKYPAGPTSISKVHKSRPAAQHALVIGIIGFLTLVDLFATQAILPSLTRIYGVSPAAIGIAVNASTFGMAAACLGITLVSSRINRRTGVWVSLTLLAVPTSLLATAPDLATFTALRVVQGVFMAAAFTLTMAYLAEHGSAEETAGALAAYVTGVVASNLVGRLVAGSIADALGVPASFYLFAALNLAGALLVYVSLDHMSPTADPTTRNAPFAAWSGHLRNPALRAAFVIGFLILFAFIGTFTYVNFVLTAPPISLGQMSLGFVYFVFLPSMMTTPAAGYVAVRIGARQAVWVGLLLAGAGLPLMIVPNLVALLSGMVLVGVGTFFAQAVTTGFVGRAASGDRAAASGLYLASYYLGGLVGAALIGQVFDNFGWSVSVAAIGLAIFLACVIAKSMDL